MRVLKKIARKFFSFSTDLSVETSTKDAQAIKFKHVDKKESSIFQTFSVVVRVDNGSKRLIVGEDSIINGAYFFENNIGNVIVGKRSFIGGSNFIVIDGIEVGDDVMISWGCTIIDNDAHSLNWRDRVNDVLDWKRGIVDNKIGVYKDWSNVEKAKIIIQNKVWIGFNSIILKGITIGEGAVVASGSVVTKDVAPYTLVGGNPARFIKELEK